MKKMMCLPVFVLFIYCTKAQLLTSSNLPLVIINTNGQPIVDNPKIMADLGIVRNANGDRNNVSDPFNHYNGKIGIEIRGQSSQQFPMKSYSLELWNSSGNSINRSLFGLPAESDWVLYAPYNEKTLMHNFLAYTISRELGHWAANCRYVEVMINGEYQGIYVLMEKIKRKDGRVNISSISNTDNDGDALTGGYIFSIDKQANAWYSQYPAGQGSIQFSYVYPKDTKITVPQKAYIQAYTDSFENALHSTQYQDKQTGWRKYANENSFIDYFLVNELGRNVDGYRLSSYFNKDRYSKGGKINAGPVWDYDLAFKNANYCDGSKIDGWAYQFNAVCPGDFWQVPDWWNKLMTDTAFKNNLNCRWKELRNTTLSTSHLNHLIDSVATLTEEARQRHFQQWPVLGQYIWPNPDPIATTYEGEILGLKSWLSSRLQWINSNIPNTGNCAGYPLNVSSSVIFTYFANPLAAGNNNIIIRSRDNQVMNIRVIDIAGRQMMRLPVSLLAGFNTIQIPANYWAAGVYFFECTNATGERWTKRVLKQ